MSDKGKKKQNLPKSLRRKIKNITIETVNNITNNKCRNTDSSKSICAARKLIKADEIASLKETVELLKKKVHTLENRVEIPELDLAVSQQTSSLLEQELDDLRQHSRRNCLIILDILLEKNETQNQLINNLKKHFFRDIGLEDEELNFDFNKIHHLEDVPHNENGNA